VGSALHLVRIDLHHRKDPALLDVKAERLLIAAVMVAVLLQPVVEIVGPFGGDDLVVQRADDPRLQHPHCALPGGTLPPCPADGARAWLQGVLVVASSRRPIALISPSSTHCRIDLVRASSRHVASKW